MRPWRLSDVDAVVAAYRDPAIQRWHVRTMTESQALDWIRSWSDHWAASSGADWVVTDSDEVVGRVGFRSVDLAGGRAGISYWTVPAARGRGIAGQVADAASSWMFKQVGLHRIELLHSTLNEASCRVATKAGFVAEGVRRSAALHADGWHDMHAHARLADD
jgi:RimJ/RimL family protein N-acetyltransferase